MEFRSNGHLAEWAVRFSGVAASQWLIQRITNSTPAVTHCDGSEYPGDGKLYDPPPAHYLEAWWIDAAGNPKVPTTLETPPSTKEPSGYGHDMWMFNSNSKKPTRGSLFRTGLLYQAPTLPADFGFNKVAAAHMLPATEAKLTGIGPRLGDRREAHVEWDHKPADGSKPWTDIHTSIP
jgi:hypothetical protein